MTTQTRTSQQKTLPVAIPTPERPARTYRDRSDAFVGLRLLRATVASVASIAIECRICSIVAAIAVNLFPLTCIGALFESPTLSWILENLAGGSLILFYLQMLALSHLITPLAMGNALLIGVILNDSESDALEEEGP